MALHPRVSQLEQTGGLAEARSTVAVLCEKHEGEAYLGI
jgi:hypothetical protein